MRTTAELREGFLTFFESKGHKRHPSGSLVPPEWDHSTLLNSAGMQPLMPYFLGREHAPGAAPRHRPEVLPHAGHRRGRARHAST